MEKLAVLTKPIFWAPWLGAVILCYFFVDRPMTIYFALLDNIMLKNIFTQINHLGQIQIYFIPVCVIFLWAHFIVKNKAIAWAMLYLLVVLAAISPCCYLFKIICGRARPKEFFLYHYYGFYFWQFSSNFWSFPSGHAMTISAVCTTLYLSLRRFAVIFLLLTLLVYFGRIVVRAHYLSDVMSGGYLGFIISFWLYHFFKDNINSGELPHTIIGD